MQQYKIKITNMAEQDLKNAGDYIANQLLNPDAAKNMIRGIRKQINKLQIYPERNELDEDPVLRDVGIRMTYYRKYKIYYVVDSRESVVYIIRIFHMLENSRKWLYKMLKL